jgi:hypothetical protein
VSDIAPSMLHFLENHDEQRIASPDFAGSAEKGKPALAVSALISSSPTLLYFGQDVGEDGSEETGFGDPTRTSIFDYVGVPAHQRFMNEGAFDGGQSTEEEKSLRHFYEQIMDIAATNSAVTGKFISLHRDSLNNNSSYSERQFAFARVKDNHGFIVVANFDTAPVNNAVLTLSNDVSNTFSANQELSPLLNHTGVTLNDNENGYGITVDLQPLETKVFAF